MSATHYKQVVAHLARKSGLSDLEAAFAANHPSNFMRAVNPGRKYQVTLNHVPENKRVTVLKAIRGVTGQSLEASRRIMNAAPFIIAEFVNPDLAAEAGKKLSEAGAIVTIERGLS